MSQYRGFLVWGIGTVVVLGAFLIFFFSGWPGHPNECVTKHPDTCYCEAFDISMIGAPHARQKANTWWNLYAIGTSFLVALFVFFDRREFRWEPTSNLIRSGGWVPDLYIFAVLFLGLGSMWFHASLTEWGGAFDGLSMYIFTAFLVFYTLRRIWDSAAMFWLGYAGTVVVFTAIGSAFSGKYTSLILILILVAAYLAFELWIWVADGPPTGLSVALWIGAVIAIIVATVAWTYSQTGGAWCDSQSWFQPHGIIWHPLAGVMAVLLYFYWRREWRHEK